MRKLMVTGLFACAAILPGFAQFVAVPCVTASATSGVAPCASESTAWLHKLMLDLSYARQLLQYAIQVQQLADMVKNSAHGGPNALNNIAADLNGLAMTIQGGRALAYSLGHQDAVFAQTYPGYQGYVPPPAMAAGPLPPGGAYASKYALWAQTSLNTTQGILRGVGMHGSLLNTEQRVLQILRTLTSNNLLSRNDAINLTGQLAAEQVGQLQKLRELQLEQMTSVAAFQGYQIQRESDGVATTARFFTSGPVISGERPYSLFPEL
jgi:P-type conjugative transfer protein TrbJ